MERSRNIETGASGSRPEEISQSLPIPATKMGWIVGKKGSYITQLCEKSGARITISESTSREFGIVWKYLQISGSGREVDKPKKLIHIRLDRLDRGSGGGSVGVGKKDSGGDGGGGSGSHSGSDDAHPEGSAGRGPSAHKEGGGRSASTSGPPDNWKSGAEADLHDEA